ncbi:MAG: helix-turn-helix transcriptional regulator [Ruthenibacterium sp.]
MFRQLGRNIARYRKFHEFSQEKLAEKAFISRGFLSHIEAPNMQTAFSIATVFDIARALNIEPKVLFEFTDDTPVAESAKNTHR